MLITRTVIGHSCVIYALWYLYRKTQILSMQVLKGFQEPLEQSLPDDVLVTASAILAPKSGLSDKPRSSSCHRTILQKLNIVQSWAVCKPSSCIMSCCFMSMMAITDPRVMPKLPLE